MKTTPLALAGWLWLASMPAFAATQTLHYEAQPSGSQMRLDGTSNIHAWSCVSHIISGYFEVESAWQSDLSLKSVTCLGPGKKPPVCVIEVPVRTLKSSSGAIMDRILVNAMQGRQFPRIQYRLTEMTVNGAVPPSGSPVKFDTKGELSFHGVTNQVSFPVTLERVGTNTLMFAGSTEIKMTDYGIQPPAPEIGQGMIKTGNAVTLHWKWTTALKK